MTRTTTPRLRSATGRRTRAARRRLTARRTAVLALVGVLGVATPALAADLDDIRDRLQKVQDDRERAGQEKDDTDQRVADLGDELAETTAELDRAQRRLDATTEKVGAARIALEEARADLADAESEADRIDRELEVARANEAGIEETLAANAQEQEQSRASVGAIARENYKSGGLGTLAQTLEVLSGEDDAVDRMAMTRTVLRVQDRQIRSLATQEAEQIAEQDRLGGVRQDIAYLLARAEAVVVEKEQAADAAADATAELEKLEAQQKQDRADLEKEQAKVEKALDAEEERADSLEDELAELARAEHGLKVEEREEIRRLEREEARRQAEAEARRKAEEKRRAEEEAARQRAAEREQRRQEELAAEARRRADAEQAAEAERRARAAREEAAEAERQRREAEEAERRREQERQREREQEQEQRSSGVLVRPTPGPVTSEFGMRFHPVLGYPRLHAGIDFGDPCGTPIRAASDGVVYSTYYSDGGGHSIIVDHGVVRGVNLTTAYLHMQSSATVGAGTSVSAGQVIGYVGTSGTSTGCHLHFETRENGTPVNPRNWL